MLDFFQMENAKRLQLREFSIYSAWPMISGMSAFEFDEYLGELGLVFSSRNCGRCRRAMTRTAQRGGIRLKWECTRQSCRSSSKKTKIGFLKGTFFERSTTDRRKLFLMSFFYVNEMGSQSCWARDLDISESAVCQWIQYCRDILCEAVSVIFDNLILGGPGLSVQLDESVLVKRKYNRGRLVRDVWMFGIVEEDTGRTVVKFVDSRDASTLIPIIQSHVHPGTTIKTDCWAAYNGLKNLGYDHRTVNHSINFVNPDDGTDTQRIEGLWSVLKFKLRRYNGLNGALFKDKLCEAIWFYYTPPANRFYSFWNMVSSKYPLN